MANTKAVLLTIVSSLLLLSQTMTLQAEPVETTAQVSEIVAETQSDGNLKAERTRDVRRGFPRWPERQKTSRSTVPPPPPGPYMSTALSGSARGVSFERNRDKKQSSRVADAQVQAEPIASSKSMDKSNSDSIDRFSPDRPWPRNIRPPSRWEPENGYQYVGVQGNNYPKMPSMQNGYSVGNFGYRPAPGLRAPQSKAGRQPGGRAVTHNSAMQRSGMSRQIAPAGTMPDPRARPQVTSPGYQPGYNAGYYKPANRSPYPAQGRP